MPHPPPRKEAVATWEYSRALTVFTIDTLPPAPRFSVHKSLYPPESAHSCQGWGETEEGEGEGLRANGRGESGQGRRRLSHLHTRLCEP